MSVFDPVGGEPDFVNPEGVKWWKTFSPDIWATLHPDGAREYVGLFDGQVVVASPRLDAVAAKLSIMKRAKECFDD